MEKYLDILIYAIAFIIAVVFHEYAHGYAAYKLGDNTAKDMGRLTLNPIKHIDPIGLISMVIFRVGWAKGVPVNSFYFKNRKRDMLIVSSAGIITNIGIAIIAAMLFKLLPIWNEILFTFLVYLVLANIMLAIFNLLPFPPLDGSKIVASILPESMERFMYRNERYFYIILMGLIFTGSISKIINPILDIVIGVLLT